MLKTSRDSCLANESLAELVGAMVGERRVEVYALHRDRAIQDRIERLVDAADRARRETLDDVIPPPGNLGKGVPCLEVHEASIGKNRAAETRGRVIPEGPTSQSIVEFQETPIRPQTVGKNKGRVGRAPRSSLGAGFHGQ